MLLVGTYDATWGHTWLEESRGVIYALKSLPGDSALCLLETERDRCEAIVYQKDLDVIGEYPTGGGHSCHITLLDRQAVVCNYSGGSLSLFDLDGDGVPCGRPQVISFEGCGNDPLRQAGPHIHFSAVSPDGSRLAVMDLGTDSIHLFGIRDGKVSGESLATFRAPAGSGPRHCVFNADGNRLYVSTELSDEVMVYDFPSMTLLQRVLANASHSGGGGHIALNPDGRHLYVSSRLMNDGIATFGVAADGCLKVAGFTPTGSHPRHFSISGDGGRMAVACRDSGTVEIHSLNQADGHPERKEVISAGKPVYVNFTTQTKK